MTDAKPSRDRKYAGYGMTGAVCWNCPPIAVTRASIQCRHHDPVSAASRSGTPCGLAAMKTSRGSVVDIQE
jgi:hypothetical protein